MLNLGELIKQIRDTIFGLIAVLLVVALLIVLFKGVTWLAETVYPYISYLSQILFSIAIFIFLPLIFFQKTKKFGVVATVGVGYFLALDLWLYSIITVHAYWGWVGLLVGLAMGGIGVIPIGLLAAGVNGDWSNIGTSSLQIAAILALIFLPVWYSTRVDKNF